MRRHTRAIDRSRARRRRDNGHAAAALAAGCLVACSLPPLGWWPLGIAGSALLASSLAGRPLGSHVVTGLLAGVAQMAIGLAWAAEFSVAGYAALVLLEALFLAAAAALVPPGRGRVPAFAAALVLAEAARDATPFGGMPLASAALGQAGGPLAGLARIGGTLAVVGGLALLGAAIAEIAPSLAAALGRRGARPSTGQLGIGLLACAALGVACCSAALSPSGGPPLRRLDVAVVQGGRLAPANDLAAPDQVLAAQLVGTDDLSKRVQVVLWPEDVVQLDGPLPGSGPARVLAATARRLGATLLAGVTEPAPGGRFRNELAAFAPSGKLVATVEKAHPVPFGEYVPLRSLFARLVNLSAVPRDAVAGRNSGEIAVPGARFAVLISYEAFFTGRGRSGVRAGGQAVLVPTNTASYASSQIPAEELAASRLQAIALGRDVLQAATAGYSALVSPSGAVIARSPLGAPATLLVELPLRSGATPYERWGSAPLLGAAALALAAAWTVGFATSARTSPGGAGVPEGSGAADRGPSVPPSTAESVDGSRPAKGSTPEGIPSGAASA